jgi:hypothetical protein
MKKRERQVACIVKDTKTYMNSEEAVYVYTHPDDCKVLFILIPKLIGSNLTERMQETVDPELWDEVVWIRTWSNGISSGQKSKKKRNAIYRYFMDAREFLFNYLDRRHLDQVAKRTGRCELVISAHKNTQEHLAAALKPDKLVLVDSGHRIFKRIGSEGYIDYSKWFIDNSRFTRYMYWWTGMKVYDRDKTEIFTVYADEIETKHDLRKNEFAYRSHLYDSKSIGSSVVWISTPIYDIAEGVSIRDYTSYVKYTMDYLKLQPEELIYVPQPGKESESDIKYIQKRLNCRVDDRDIPVESKLANYKELPKACVSPFSSALVNILAASKGRIDAISAWHYEFDFFEIWSDWKRDVEKNEELNIQFLNLESSPPMFHIQWGEGERRQIYKTFKEWPNKKN